MANIIPPDHVDDLPDPALAIPEPALVDENEEPEEEEEFEDEEEFEEENPQEKEYDMEVDIEEEENEPELIFPYVKANLLNPLPPASDSENEDVIEVEDTVDPKDETVPASVYEVGESSTASFHREDSDGLLPGFMRRDINSLFSRMTSLSRRLCGRETAHALVEKKGKAKDKYYGKLILDLGNEVRSSVEEGMAAMENLVRKLGNAEEKAECKELKKELEESRSSNILLRTNGSVDDSTNSLKGHNMFNKSLQVYNVAYVFEAYFVQYNDVACWVDSGATMHVCKDRCWFNTYKSLNDRSILHMGNESTDLVHGHRYVDLRLGRDHSMRMQYMSKDGLILDFNIDTEKCETCMLTKITKKSFQNVKRETEGFELIHSDLCDLHATVSLRNKKYFVTFIDDALRFCYVYLLHSKDEALDKFKSVGIIYETTASYTPQQNGISERENRVLKEMVNSMLSYKGLSQGFWGEAMLTPYYLLNRVPNKRNRITLYELWTKRKPNLNYLRVWGYKAVVRLPDLKLKTLGKRRNKCIFVGYAEHFKAFRFYDVEPNERVLINSIIESRDAIFDENKLSSVLRLSLGIPNGTEDTGGLVVPEEVTKEEHRMRSLTNTPIALLLRMTPNTFKEAMKSQDVAF
ncbi:zinc finger, CCHC-type containing protein [Tanacetum coccineum]